MHLDCDFLGVLVEDYSLDGEIRIRVETDESLEVGAVAEEGGGHGEAEVRNAINAYGAAIKNQCLLNTT